MRNTYAICPEQEDSSGKLELTLHKTVVWHHTAVKSTEVPDEHADDWLVGGVTDHQGNDQ